MTVGELASAAEVTTGAIYHHFGSKLGLYSFVRQDVERRLLDRIEGALAAVAGQPDNSEGVRAALLVGFNFAITAGFPRMLGVPPMPTEIDLFAELLTRHTTSVSPLLGQVLAAGWRAALVSVADGADPADARVALSALLGGSAPQANA